MADDNGCRLAGATGGNILPRNGAESASRNGFGLIDWEEARRFLTLIGRGAGPLVVAVFPPEDGPNIHLSGDLGEAHRAEVERTLARHPGHGFGLVVNPAHPEPTGWGQRAEEQRRDGSPRVWGASNDHIRGAVGIWAECDGGLSREEQQQLPALAGLPEPTAAVWSGGKSLHLYWLLQQEEELLAPGQFRELQRRLAAAIERAAPQAKPDRAISNPARVMRWPGGTHPKTGQRTALLEGPRRWFTAEELELLIPQPPSPEPTATTATAGRIHLPSTTVVVGGGDAWFDRRSREDQRALAVEMVRHLPLRTSAGQGRYQDSLRALAGLVHQFGADDAGAICEEAGWRSSAWDPAAKARTIGEAAGSAGMGTTIRLAREAGWRHPLDATGGEQRAGIGMERPQPAADGRGASSSTPATFEERWRALEDKATELAGSEKPAVRVVAELGEASSELVPKLSRRDLEHLLEAAQRRLRPAAAPILPGDRFTVSPNLWAVDGLVRHGLNLLVGQSGAGKTRLSLALAAAWLRGDQTWLGYRLEGPPSVEERHLLILGTDQNREDWGLAMAPLGLVEDLGGGGRRLHQRVTLHPMESGTVLDADGLRMVRRWCDDHPGGMVLADSLAQLLPPGIDEDRPAAARPVHALAEALGSCWGLLLHHTRKAAGREGNLGIGAGRGSGAIDAAVCRVIGLGLLHRMEHGQSVPQESDDRRELLSTKRGGKTVHVVVSSDGSGAWRNEGSADALKTEERRQRAVTNLTENQSGALAVLEEQPGQLLTTRQLWEAMGRDWEADRAEGGAGTATLRKTLKRLEVLGLVESVLAGNERTYRAAAARPAMPAEEAPYESPERAADTREERIPQHVREERDADRLWEAQHRQRTEQEGELLAAQHGPPQPPLAPLPIAADTLPLPEVGEVVEVSNGRGGWDGGYRVTRADHQGIELTSEATGRSLTKTPSATRPQWRRPEGHRSTAAA